MTDTTAPRTALAALEAAARDELAQLAAALPTAPPAADPLLAHVAWDLGLAGSDLAAS